MKKAVKIKKESKKKDLLQKIIKDRLAETQELGWLFRPLCICPLPAQPLPKKRVLLDNGKTDKEHETLWKRKAGKYMVEIQGHKDYGIPYGQDILIILYLAIEAKRQNSRRIKVNFYRDFMNMFDMNANDGRKYALVRESIFRIKESKFSWRDITVPDNRQKGGGFLYIDDYDLYFNPKNPDQISLFEQYILLSERFWYEINQYEIPFNLEAVRFLKRKAAHLNFYIWLSYRVWYCYYTENGTAAINFWGSNGLQQQTSSRIIERRYYRREVNNYLESVKEVWPECPVEIVNDSLRINITSTKQLDIQEKPAQKVFNFQKPKELEPGKEETEPGQEEPAKRSDDSQAGFEADFRYYGARGKNLKEALAKPADQIERNLIYFKGLLKKMQANGKKVLNPGALLCDAVIQDYAKQSPHELEEQKKKEEIKRQEQERENEAQLIKEKKKEFYKLIDKKIADGLKALPPGEMVKIENDFVELVTQQPHYAKFYKEKGLKSRTIQIIRHSFMGDKFLSEEEQDFEKYMESQGLPVVEEYGEYRLKRNEE